MLKYFIFLIATLFISFNFLNANTIASTKDHHHSKNFIVAFSCHQDNASLIKNLDLDYIHLLSSKFHVQSIVGIDIEVEQDSSIDYLIAAVEGFQVDSFNYLLDKSSNHVYTKSQRFSPLALFLLFEQIKIPFVV